MTNAGRDSSELRSAITALDLAVLVAFLACAVLLAAIGIRLARLVDMPRAWCALLAGAIAGALAADFATGLVHWACDTFFAEDTPLLGPALIAPFRAHHRDPLAITRHGFLEVNGSNCFALVPLLAAAWWRDAALLCDAFFVAFAPAVLVTNQFHKWAHAPVVPRVVWWMQRARCILRPQAHARHHHAGGRGAYCVTFGWLNPSLDRIALFPGLERVIRSMSRLLFASGVDRRPS